MEWQAVQWPQLEALHLQGPGVQLAACGCCCQGMAVGAVAAVHIIGELKLAGSAHPL